MSHPVRGAIPNETDDGLERQGIATRTEAGGQRSPCGHLDRFQRFKHPCETWRAWLAGVPTPYWIDPAWGERVRHAVAAELERGSTYPDQYAWRSNGAHHQHSRSTIEDGIPVLYVVYTHPWWTFTTGLRRRLDRDPMTAGPPEDPAKRLAGDIVLTDVGEPLGMYADSMVPDAQGVWWWGDDPLPGDPSRRGPAPKAPSSA